MTVSPRGPAAFLRRFACDDRGVSAIEFAFIAPILIVFYFGMAEVCQLLIAKRRVSHSGAAVADLVSQTDAPFTTKDELRDQMLAAESVMAPFPTAPLTMRVFSVTKETASTGLIKVDWSCEGVLGEVPTCPSGARPKASTFAPATPLNPGESLIVAELSYNYSSSIGYFIPGVKVMKHKAELRPRKQDVIGCTDCG
ncbi:MAG: pilus assembly protein [Proteobacteria bacterium]|nr:pilus assembly protein [Pseudomonadota bacterium]